MPSDAPSAFSLKGKEIEHELYSLYWPAVRWLTPDWIAKHVEHDGPAPDLDGPSGALHVKLLRLSPLLDLFIAARLADLLRSSRLVRDDYSNLCTSSCTLQSLRKDTRPSKRVGWPCQVQRSSWRALFA